MFDRAFAEFERQPWHALNAGNHVIERLIKGWGNEVWSAGADFIGEILKEVARGTGPILECGSGLTTLVLAVAGRASGREVVSLEHNDERGSRIQAILDTYRLYNLKSYTSSLRDYGDYSWYDPPLSDIPAQISLVVCNGPPGNTKGGRIGMLPVLGEHLSPDVRILLDDAARQAEIDTATQWAGALNKNVCTRGTDRPFIVISEDSTRDVSRLANGSQPHVTVGIPTYNNGSYLVDSIESALSQTGVNVEVIVSDNASSDGSESTCKRIAAADKRLYYFRQPENQGVFKNYDDVFLKSRTEYFKWQSGSDTCDPTFAERCVKLLEENDDVVLACPRVRLVDEEGRSRNYDNDFGLMMDRPSDRFIFLVNNIGLSNLFNGVVRSTALSRTPLNKQYRGSDIPILASLALQGKVALIEERLWSRIMTAETASAHKSEEETKEFFSGSSSHSGQRETWKMMYWLIVAVATSDISGTEKLRCFRFLGRKLLWARRTLARELFEF